MRHFFWIFTLVIAMWNPICGEAAEQPIRVAALFNLTGDMASIDAPGFRGAQLAANRINAAGGLLGRKLQLIVVDSRSDPTSAAEGAYEVLEKGVSAGIGYGDTTYVLAAGPEFAKRGIPFITSGATDPNLPRDVGPTLLMAAYGDDEQAAAVADFAVKDLKAKRFVLWTDVSTDFTRDLAEYFKESVAKLGGQLVAQDVFKAGTRDFTPHVKRLKAVNPQPDAIFVSAAPGEAATAVTQIRQSGITVPILSGDGFDSDLAKQLTSPNAANEIYFSTHSYRGQTRPEVLAFIEEYKKEYGMKPENAFAALGFDALNLLADAIKRANSVSPDPLLKALYETRTFPGVTGEISYVRPNRAPIKPISIIGIKNSEYSVIETWKPGH
jgi:branched-chain amino acid transport system substrate-binding protein